METGARARGLAGWERERAWRWCLRVLGRGGQGAGRLHANDGAQRERGRAKCERALRNSNRLHRIRNPRIPLKPHAMFFSNRSKIACLRAHFAQVSRTTNHQSRYAGAFLIASRQLLEIRLTRSQQTRKLFLIASFSPFWA